MKSRLTLVVAALVLAGCSGPPVSVSLMDQSDELARFTVENTSALDVRSVSFVVRYEVEGEDAPRRDTVSWHTTRSSSGEIPFVRAGEETFFSHTLPRNASRLSAEVLRVGFWDGTQWPADGGGS